MSPSVLQEPVAITPGVETLDAAAVAPQTPSTMRQGGPTDDGDEGHLVPIDHAAIIDGFQELDGFTHYLAFRVSCGACPTVVTVTPEMQQHLLEVARIPF